MSSMNLTDIRELYRNSGDYIDREVTVGGWVRSIRDSKAFGFIVLNDGTFFEPLQVVYHDTLANFETVSRLNVGSAIVARGKIVATPQAKQAFEMQRSVRSGSWAATRWVCPPPRRSSWPPTAVWRCWA